MNYDYTESNEETWTHNPFDTMSLFHTPKNAKVIYLNKNGYDSDRKQANMFLVEGHTYTVSHINIGRSSSEVTLNEFPSRGFNTVMFANAEPVDENVQGYYFKDYYEG